MIFTYFGEELKKSRFYFSWIIKRRANQYETGKIMRDAHATLLT